MRLSGRPFPDYHPKDQGDSRPDARITKNLIWPWIDPMALPHFSSPSPRKRTSRIAWLAVSWIVTNSRWRYITSGNRSVCFFHFQKMRKMYGVKYSEEHVFSVRIITIEFSDIILEIPGVDVKYDQDTDTRVPTRTWGRGLLDRWVIRYSHSVSTISEKSTNEFLNLNIRVFEWHGQVAIARLSFALVVE